MVSSIRVRARRAKTALWELVPRDSAFRSRRYLPRERPPPPGTKETTTRCEILLDSAGLLSESFHTLPIAALVGDTSSLINSMLKLIPCNTDGLLARTHRFSEFFNDAAGAPAGERGAMPQSC